MAAHLVEILKTPKTCINGSVVGDVVDGVSDVIALKAGDIKESPTLRDGHATNLVTGIATVKQGEQVRMFILMDIERLVSSEEFGITAKETA